MKRSVLLVLCLASCGKPAGNPAESPPVENDAQRWRRDKEEFRRLVEDCPLPLAAPRPPDQDGNYQLTPEEWEQARRDLRAYRDAMGLPPLPGMDP